MTSAVIKAQIAHAKARAAAGDCASAEQILNEAWVDLGNYSRALAARGQSPAAALSAHKLLTKAHAQIRRRCLELAEPTFAPMPRNPELLEPTFHGAGPFETVGWGTAVLGLFALGAIAFGVGRMRA